MDCFVCTNTWGLDRPHVAHGVEWHAAVLALHMTTPKSSASSFYRHHVSLFFVLFHAHVCCFAPWHAAPPSVCPRSCIANRLCQQSVHAVKQHVAICNHFSSIHCLGNKPPVCGSERISPSDKDPNQRVSLRTSQHYRNSNVSNIAEIMRHEPKDEVRML